MERLVQDLEQFHLCETFPLFQLHSTILEKIVIKLHWEAYFRLQQTCKYLEKFVRTNPHIKNITSFYYTNTQPHLYCKMRSNGSLQLCCKFQLSYSSVYFYAPCPYGVRFEELTVPNRIDDEYFFEYFCAALRKHRISCEFLHRAADYTNEEWVKLFKILQPISFHLYSHGSNLMEVLQQSRRLKNASVWVDLYDINEPDLHLMKGSISKLEKLSVYVDKWEPMDQFLLFINNILQFLHSASVPTLQEFVLIGKDLESQPLPTLNEVVDIFDGLKLTLSKPKTNGTSNYVFDCRLGINQYSCELAVHCQFVSVIVNRIHHTNL